MSVGTSWKNVSAHWSRTPKPGILCGIQMLIHVTFHQMCPTPKTHSTGTGNLPSFLQSPSREAAAVLDS